MMAEPRKTGRGGFAEKTAKLQTQAGASRVPIEGRAAARIT